MKTTDLKTALDTSVDNAAKAVKKNKILTGALAGGALGTFLFPIPVIGTLVGVWAGVKVAEKIGEEDRKDQE